MSDKPTWEDYSATLQEKLKDIPEIGIHASPLDKHLRYNRTVLMAPCRRCGKTSWLIETLKNTIDGVVLVQNQPAKRALVKQVPEAEGRVFTVEELRKLTLEDTQNHPIAKTKKVYIDNFSLTNQSTTQIYAPLSVFDNPDMVVIGLG